MNQLYKSREMCYNIFGGVNMIPNAEPMIVNRDPRPRGCEIGEESHRWHEFVYYISCEGSLLLDGKQYDIKPGRFVTIPPDTLHSEVHTSDGIVFFCIFRSNAHFDCAVFDDDSDRKILRLCESIHAEQIHPTAQSRELQTLMLKELLLRTARWNETRRSVRHDLEHAAEAIRMNFREPLKIADLAAEIGYGYDYFQHSFKTAFGRSPKQMQLDCRIEAAKNLLRTGEYNCTEIAYLCGFSDSAQFASIFRRETGLSPRKWQKHNIV